MINHARTLLVNVSGELQPQYGIAYDAYIPKYDKLALRGDLALVYKSMFGNKPDYQGLCFRVAQCLSTISSTPYSRYLYALDSRITYDFSAYRSDVFPEVVAKRSTGDTLTITGQYSIPEAEGRADALWQIKWSDGVGSVTSTEGRDTTIDFNKSLRLPNSNLFVESSSVVDGEQWDIRFRDIPHNFSGVMDRLLDSDKVVASLFGSSVSEPFSTFYALTTHAMFPYRASGLLLAYVYKLEEQRLNEL